MEWREKTVDHLTAAAHRATAEKQTSDALSRCAGYLEDLGWGQQPTRALACAAGWGGEWRVLCSIGATSYHPDQIPEIPYCSIVQWIDIGDLNFTWK